MLIAAVKAELLLVIVTCSINSSSMAHLIACFMCPLCVVIHRVVLQLLSNIGIFVLSFVAASVFSDLSFKTFKTCIELVT